MEPNEAPFVKSVGSVSAAAAQHGHDHATLHKEKKAGKEHMRKVAVGDVTSSTVLEDVWEKAIKTAMPIASTLASSSPKRSNAESKVLSIAASLIVIKGPTDVVVYNNPKQAEAARDALKSAAQ